MQFGLDGDIFKRLHSQPIETDELRIMMIKKITLSFAMTVHVVLRHG